MPDVPPVTPMPPSPPPVPIYIPVPAQAPQGSSRTGCAIAVLLGFLLAVSVFFNFILGVTSMKNIAGAGGSEGGWTEKYVAGDEKSSNKIVMIPIEGVISSKEGFSIVGKMENVQDRVTGDLRRAAQDKSVKGIILAIDSPGGEMTACDEIYQEIQKYRKDHPMPIVASMGDVAASGGYYLAVTADEVWARPTTLTGSIGVIIETYNLKEGMEKLGVKMNVIKSADKKDILSPAREMTAEEKKLLQGIVDELYGSFVDVVLKGRKNLDPEKLKKLADGSVFTGNQAKTNGLVDQVGFLDDVIASVKKKASLADAKVIKYKRPEGLMDILSPSAAGGEERANIASLAQRLLQDRSSRAMAIWRPGE